MFPSVTHPKHIDRLLLEYSSVFAQQVDVYLMRAHVLTAVQSFIQDMADAVGISLATVLVYVQYIAVALYMVRIRAIPNPAGLSY